MGKNLSNKYGRKRLDSAKKSTADAIKAASKRAIKQIAETTGDLVGDKIADKVFQKSLLRNCTHKMRIKQKYQKKNAYLQKKGNKLLMN